MISAKYSSGFYEVIFVYSKF